ncbi:hypothetical protein [Streptomyces macrosporus]|uniref:Transferase n=1 Tax=Streptomyces macrosporus TaxID=44032 RepID=A0ABN3KJU3_9ACTN
MGTRDSTSGTAPAATFRRHPRPVTATLLALYAAAAAVGLTAGGAAERLLGLALLTAVALRLAPYRHAARTPREDVPPAGVRARTAGDGDAADA